MDPLPIDSWIETIAGTLAVERRLVLVAPPGSGKTTRVPPALIGEGPVILLQPRRVAARSLARRIASERGWTIGREIGWQVRLERRFSSDTRLLVATEGILTARLQSDPLLSEFRTVILDEFHERSVHADLAIAMVREALAARDDLRLVVMSATLDAEAVARYLGGAPVIEAGGPLHPVEIRWRPDTPMAQVTTEACEESRGSILAFLPGRREIDDLHAELNRRMLASRAGGIAILPLHGSLDASAQDQALARSTDRRVILATNIAETSLTVEGVSTVIDSGLQKVLRFDPALGIDRLETERISVDSADQRAGRAGRLGPGICIRLWDSRDLLDLHREPEIVRVDLAPVLLEVIGWGADPRSFGWFEPPPTDHLESALALLARLGAIDSSPAPRLTEKGRMLRRLPLPPRLGAFLIEAEGTRNAARACAILADDLRAATTGGEGAAASDLLPLLDRFGSFPERTKRSAEEIERTARSLGIETVGEGDREAAMLRAALAGW
ncbi:MAG TPA: helicase-related protein, partial [Thermoanaerobaculia bacterium]|nr:helicase-related protein [Thermoanaerobaculia bacterium]